jgi:hypothetical protein
LNLSRKNSKYNSKRIKNLKKGIAKAILLMAVLATAGVAAESEKLGDVTDGSRAPFVHLIPLLAEPLPGQEPDQIYPEDVPLLPFSTKATCGACHSYDVISTGWHFNAVDPCAAPGRKGQPWILADPATATQIPLSYRAWPGTFRPQELGIMPTEFVHLFGRQMPGGGIGEMLDKTDNPEEFLRASITGQLEINCLACHNINPGQDMGGAAGWAAQIMRGNFRWAATASCEFAYVSGTTRDLMTNYDFRVPFVSDDTKLRPPVVEYRKEAFGHNDWIRFDISREIPNQRCYFCHSNVDIHNGKTEQWKTDEDIHIAAGLKCVDCHSHGLEHNITRGYTGEPSDSNNPLAAVSSCEGCHLRSDEGTPLAGRFAAPVPKHTGLPPSHFEKLSCTACHSGPWPSANAIGTKTARAHAIGVAGAYKQAEVLPHLLYPVFVKGHDGKITSHKLFWPAYWAAKTGDSITPLDLNTVRSVTVRVITRNALSIFGDWPSLKEEDIARILSLLASKVPEGAKPIYITGGRIYSLVGEGQLSSTEHEMAAPCMWPIAHDVRPAAQSLGMRDCGDCHSTDSPFFFGLVAVDSPLKSTAASGVEMIKFEDLPKFYTKAFAISFVFRPWLKAVAIAASVLIGGVLLLYALRALAFVTKAVAGEGIAEAQLQRIEIKRGIIGLVRKLTFVLGLLSFAVLAASGFLSIYVLGESVSGWWLMAHVTAGGVFAICMAAAAVLWAEKNHLWVGREKKTGNLPARICFWGVIAATLPAILSTILSMFNLFGTDGQEFLLKIHHYSTLLLTLFAVVYLGFMTSKKGNE